MVGLTGTLIKETPILSQVQDASRFFRYHSSILESSPLEVYKSVLLFTPKSSRIRSCFQEEVPDWVEMKPAIEDWTSCVQTLEAHEIAGFQHLEWAPDGTRLTSFSRDGAIKIWDLAGNRCVSSFQTHGLVGTSATWSSDGAYIASASSDLKIKIWDPETGQCLSTLLGHEFPINAVFWSEDAARLVSLSWSQKQENPSPFTIKVWDRMTSQCVLTINGDNNPISSAFPSYDRKRIVSVAHDGIIKTWEIFTHQRMSSRKVYPQPQHLSFWSHDGMSFIHSDWLSNTINIIDTSTWKPIKILKSDDDYQIMSFALPHDGKQLALGSADGIVEIWDLTTGKRVSTLHNHLKNTARIAWLRDGRLVSGSYDAIIKIWDPSTSQCLSTFHGQRGDIRSLLLSPDETRLISTAAFDSTIKVWDLSSSKAIEGHSQEVTCIVWSYDGSCFASYSNKEAKVWDPLRGECLSTLTNPKGDILKICWSSGGEMALLSSVGTVFIFNTSTGQVSWTIESIEPSAALAWSSDGSQLMLASYDNLINTWDTKARKHLSTVKADNIGISVTWSRDATRFASVAENWSIMIQNPYTGKCISQLEGYHCSEFDQIPVFLRRPVFMSWSYDGTRLASAMGPTVKIWDLTISQCTLVLELDEVPDQFQFNFPRGPSFGETDPRYLHTSIGSIDIAPHADPTTDISARLICSPRPKGFGVSQCGSWITHNGVKLLALPSDYGPRVPEAFAILSSTVVFGSVTGRVLILKFSKQMFDGR
ncbi:hypothetical protein N7520_001526 [Penicillium odoratum]|uniref:uncharacterized protein n=1 Tax=Penicillium odoratum TaxID=1167516 RepID=UPI002546A9C5|nr:uncharacterized protein N7520_001526 [Penicillium odoratum]KAJ5778280.1 hypothetical protein N7520_001526 [Penicillium odoratum]